MHVRKAIATDICDKIKTISKDSGYRTDVTAADVYHWSIQKFEQKKDLEVINVKDLKVLYRGEYQTLVVKIIVGAIKADDNYSIITERMLDIYKCLQDNYGFFLEKYGYWEVDILDEDELIIEQDDYRIAESAINLEITFNVSETGEPDNREF
jgi:hypothetical protein